MTMGMTAASHTQLQGTEIRRGLTALLRRRVPPQEVEDIAQTVLCDALAAGNIPSDPEEFRRWLTGIARHKIADFHRRAARRRTQTMGEAAELVPASPSAFEEREVLENLLSEPRNRRDAETMEWLVREHDGERLIDIASEEGLPAPVVRQRVSRFRRALRARWVGVFGLLVVAGAGGAYALHGPLGAPAAAVAETPPAHPSIAADPALHAPRVAPSAAPSALDELRGDWVIQTITPARALTDKEQRLSELFVKTATVHVGEREIVIERKGVRLVYAIASVEKGSASASTLLHVTSEAGLPSDVGTIRLTMVRDARGPRLDAVLSGGRLSGTVALRRPIL